MSRLPALKGAPLTDGGVRLGDLLATTIDRQLHQRMSLVTVPTSRPPTYGTVLLRPFKSRRHVARPTVSPAVRLYKDKIHSSMF